MDRLSVTDVAHGRTYSWVCREWFDKTHGNRKEWLLDNHRAGKVQQLELVEGLSALGAPGSAPVVEEKWSIKIYTAKVGGASRLAHCTLWRGFVKPTRSVPAAGLLHRHGQCRALGAAIRHGCHLAADVTADEEDV